METVRRIAPYLLAELLLPGGTMVALALWLYRRQARRNPLDFPDPSRR